jgi:DNA-binding transcriptional ArsR family regulator
MPKPLPMLLDLAPIDVTPLGDEPSLSEVDAIALAVRLKALADPTRLRLLVFMLDQPEQEACTCELAPFVGLSEPTVSHHLKRLEGAGLVTKERRGMSVHYRVVPEAIHAIAKVLHMACDR